MNTPPPLTLPAQPPLGHPPATPWHRRLHRLGARVLVAFVLLHLLNHLTALGGVATHQQVLEVLRWIYRHPWVEPVLLLAVLSQAASGSRAA